MLIYLTHHFPHRESETRGFWVGLNYDLHLDKVVWADGTDPAPDMPWRTNERTGSATFRYGRIYFQGGIGVVGDSDGRRALCGSCEYVSV